MVPETTPPEASRRRSWIGVAILVGTVVAVATVGVIVWGGNDTPTRQQRVAQRGAEVMPFDLDATEHRFDATPTGAVETVTAKRSDDTAQIALIREHLRDEATRFQRGDFGDPATIHGDDMPGLRALESGPAEIEIVYTDRPSGATITFTTDDATMRSALADWVMAQNMDHGTGMNHG